MKPIDIRIENYSTKTGVTCNPVISWEYADSDAGQQQEFCRIFVYQNDRCVYDSGRVRTQDQTNHEIHMDLYTHQTYSIIVEAENTEGNIEISDNVYFSTGVMEGEWCGEWISDKSSLPHYLRGEIEINRPVDKAYISVAGAGQYELKINGKFPDDSVLNGSWTDFNKRIHYRTFEIEKILRMGSNIFSIEVGNGWYHAETDERHFYTIDKGYENFGDFLCATAVITLRFSDGEVVHMGTGPDWKTGKSETLFTNIYGSEDYDARMEEESEWSPAIVLKKTEASGEVPDLMQMNLPENYYTYSADTYLEPLNDEEWINRLSFDKSEIEYTDGNIYGMPITGFSGVMGVVYNKQVFADLGLEIPKTYDGFIEVCNTIKESGITPIQMSGNDSWTIQIAPMIFLANALDDRAQETYDGLYNGELTFADIPEFKQALEEFQKLFEEGYTNADYAVASCLYTQIPESRINTELFNHHQKTEYPYNHTENAF